MLNQFIVLGVVNFLRTCDAGIPFNRGMVRPLTVTLPEGSLLNPTKYAPTGIRYTTALRVSDVVMGALSQAVPSRIPAAGSGQFGLLTLSDLEPKTGSYAVHVLQPLQGGSGGRPGKDGIDGVNFSGGALRNAPVEALELDAPIFVRRYELNDSVAPGKWRGGSGIVFECQLLSPHAQISSRGWGPVQLQSLGARRRSRRHTWQHRPHRCRRRERAPDPQDRGPEARGWRDGAHHLARRGRLRRSAGARFRGGCSATSRTRS